MPKLLRCVYATLLGMFITRERLHCDRYLRAFITPTQRARLGWQALHSSLEGFGQPAVCSLPWQTASRRALISDPAPDAWIQASTGRQLGWARIRPMENNRPPHASPCSAAGSQASAVCRVNTGAQCAHRVLIAYFAQASLGGELLRCVGSLK